MFQFPSFASAAYVFSGGSRGLAAGGFPIRKSPGQSLLGGSPELIAACHVLHRLLTPGHPPCALIRLTTTRCMKEFRTPSRSVFKEPGRIASRAPIKQETSNPFIGRLPRYAVLACQAEARRNCPPPLLAFNYYRRFGATAGQPSLSERRLVEVNGIEPMTSWLQTRRSPN